MLGFLGDVRYDRSPALSLKDEGAVRRATGAFPFRSWERLVRGAGFFTAELSCSSAHAPASSRCPG